MNKEFLREMEAQMRAEHARISEELAAIAAQNPKNQLDHVALFQGSGDNEEDNATATEEQTANKTLERTLDASLRDIEKGLERLAKGSYGICKYCNKEIDEKRLRARPESSSCIECKKSFTQEM